MAGKKRTTASTKYVQHTCKKCGKQFMAWLSADRSFCSIKCMATSGILGRHKQSSTRLHQIWCHMKTRCFCTTSSVFKYYGGRGIAVCDEWANRFEVFRDWANANGYTDELEIDRIDVNGNYEPSNCRWATRTQQMANTRKRKDGASSPFKGVSWCENVKKWRAQISINGTNTHVAVRKTAVEAAIAYDDAAYKLRGEYAHLNFPERKRSSGLGREGVRMPEAGASGNGLSRPHVAFGGEHCTSSNKTEVSHFNFVKKTW